MKNWSNGWRRGGAAVWILALAALLGKVIWWYGDQVGLVENHHKLLAYVLIIVIAMLSAFAPRLLMHLKRQNHRELGLANKVYPQADADILLPRNQGFSLADFQEHMGRKHGPFWRRKTRLFLVIGEAEQIKAIAPNLSSTHWLQGQGTVLLWGGSVQGKLDDSVLELCRHLTRWRALDGVVWALSREQSADQRAISLGVNHLATFARQLKWPLPLHLWQVCDSQWAQDGRPVQPVGCRLPAALTPEALDAALASLLEPLRREGLAQMNEQPRHDFLLRLSRDLQVEGTRPVQTWTGPGSNSGVRDCSSRTARICKRRPRLPWHAASAVAWRAWPRGWR